MTPVSIRRRPITDRPGQSRAEPIRSRLPPGRSTRSRGPRGACRTVCSNFTRSCTRSAHPRPWYRSP